MKNVSMNRLSWLDYQRRMRDEGAPVFLPVGALEQHGPHLPLGTDALLSAAVAEGAAAETSGIVAPALAYGYKSQPKCGGGQHFPGTTSLDAQTLIHQVRDVVREFARHGVQKLVIVNGHFENQWFLIEGIDLAMRDLGGRMPLTIMRMEYWDFFTQATLDRVFPGGFPGYALEHAAVIETSMMLHYHPELVRLDLIPGDPPAAFPPYDIYPTRTEWVPPSGVLSSAREATVGKGVAMADELRTLIASAVRKELG
jgi:creatinine amidohydrolase